MLLFWKVVDETEMGNPRDHAAIDVSSNFSIFLPLRAILKKTYHYETPCIRKKFVLLAFKSSLEIDLKVLKTCKILIFNSKII